MTGPWSRDLALLDAQVALAELQAVVIAAEAEAGLNIPNARRPLSEAELTSGIRLGAYDSRLQAQAQRILELTDPVAEAVAVQMRRDLATASTPEEVRAQTQQWASPLTAAPFPTLAPIVGEAEAAISDTYRQAWDDAAADVRDEARYQGISGVPDTGPAIDPVTATIIATTAAVIVSHRVGRMINAAAEAARVSAAPQAATVAQAAVTATLTVSTAGTVDLARQGIHQVSTASRVTQATQPALPPIAQLYASELLDENTCDPCAATDGTEYATLDAARVDYREHGGHRRCRGDLRCRGTLVIVWAKESPPSMP